jgi:hypothetical protein
MHMNLYLIFRRHGFRDAEVLSAAAARSRAVGQDMADAVRWIRTYAVAEQDGSLGTVCVYEATDPAALREHARCAELPIDEIVAVGDTLIVRPDPVAGAPRGAGA